MISDEKIRAIRKLTEETILELRKANAEEQSIYDRVLKELEEAKIHEIETKIHNTRLTAE